MLSLTSEFENRRKKWVRALRSGLFKQGQQKLSQRDISGNLLHCCLGVACELAILDGVDISKKEDRNNIFFGGNTACLPEPVMEWLGIREDLGWISPEAQSLASMNDNGKTFEDIAAYIESNPVGLFVEN